jgi:lysophospholipase L1-like esterase
MALQEAERTGPTGRDWKRRASLGARLALSIGTVGVTLLVAEASVRVWAALQPEATLDQVVEKMGRPPADGPGRWAHVLRTDPHDRISYGLRRNFDGWIETGSAPFRLSTNRHGFRGPQWSVEKPAGTVRILGIGDSMMMGYSVAIEDSYLARLEEELRANHPECRFEVLNLAVGGYNTVQEVATLREIGLAFDPDLVLLGVVENDQNGIIYLNAPDNVFSLRRSFLYDGLTKVTGARNEGRFGGWEELRDAIQELSELPIERGFEALVFAITTSGPTQRMLEIASACGLRTEDLGTLLGAHLQERGIQDYYASDLVIGPFDGHPSPLHHRRIARDLASVLEKQGLVASCLARARSAPPQK